MYDDSNQCNTWNCFKFDMNTKCRYLLYICYKVILQGVKNQIWNLVSVICPTTSSNLSFWGFSLYCKNSKFISLLTWVSYQTRFQSRELLQTGKDNIPSFDCSSWCIRFSFVLITYTGVNDWSTIIQLAIQALMVIKKSVVQACTIRLVRHKISDGVKQYFCFVLSRRNRFWHVLPSIH